MDMNYYVKHVYGVEQMYLADKEQAHAVQLISGQKTITPYTKEGLERLGYTFKQVLPTK